MLLPNINQDRTERIKANNYVCNCDTHYAIKISFFTLVLFMSNKSP